MNDYKQHKQLVISLMIVHLLQPIGCYKCTTIVLITNFVRSSYLLQTWSDILPTSGQTYQTSDQHY